MIIDSRVEFGAKLTPLPTGGAGVATVYGNVVDLISGGVSTYGMTQTTDPFGGNSEDLYAVMFLDTTAITATSIQFQLVSSAAAALTTPTVHFDTGAVPIANCVAGYQVFVVQLPRGTYKRYLGILTTNAGAAQANGTGYAFLTTDPRAFVAAPDAL